MKRDARRLCCLVTGFEFVESKDTRVNVAGLVARGLAVDSLQAGDSNVTWTFDVEFLRLEFVFGSKMPCPSGSSIARELLPAILEARCEIVRNVSSKCLIRYGL